MNSENRVFAIDGLYKLLAVLFGIFWIYFLMTTRSQTNWWIENILVLLFIPFFIYLQSHYTFSNLSLICIFLFLMTHIYGAQMSYTYNQLGALLQNHFQLSRNPYDRIVHFSFGLFITYPLHEYFVRSLGCPHKWSYTLTWWTLLGLATVFELIEWLVAACTDSATGESYVATQGDVWDAHKDIALALLASLLINVLLHFNHKRKSIISYPIDKAQKAQ